MTGALSSSSASATTGMDVHSPPPPAEEDSPKAPSLARLASIGITSHVDVLFRLPRDYEDYRRPRQSFFDAPVGESIYIEATVVARELRDASARGKSQDNLPGISKRAAPKRLQLDLRDEVGRIFSTTVFGNVWAWEGAGPGERVAIRGKVGSYQDQRKLDNPVRVKTSYRGRVVPVYPLAAGKLSEERAIALTEYAVDHCIEAAAARVLALFEGLVEREVIDAAGGGYQHLRDWLCDLHRPLTPEEGRQAIAFARRVAAAQVLRTGELARIRDPEPRSAISIDPAKVSALLAALPVKPTPDQVLAIEETVADLQSTMAMRRVLTGDVGTGKTIAYLLPAVAAQLAGAKVAVIMPNALIARQVADECKALFPTAGVWFITSQEKHMPALAGVSWPLVIGTTAVNHAIKEPVDYLVVDEQGRFGRAQREVLADGHTNMLEVSATPIPRTTALVSYAGMALSTLRTSPVEKRIETRIVEAGEARALFDRVLAVTRTGGQVAVVYPLVEGEDPKASVTGAAQTWARFVKETGVIHGRMDDDEKQEVMARMRRGEFKVLVASSVIEMGITLPDLRNMVVVCPERCGVLTLHQLRGRLARAGGAGQFWLYLKAPISDEARARLQLLVEKSDGFELAEADMARRGFGDLAGDAEDQIGKAQTLFPGLRVDPRDIAALQSHATRPGP